MSAHLFLTSLAIGNIGRLRHIAKADAGLRSSGLPVADDAAGYGTVMRERNLGVTMAVQTEAVKSRFSAFL